MTTAPSPAHTTAPVLPDGTSLNTAGAPGDNGDAGVAAPSIAVIVVTWNRKHDASNILAALARQDYPRQRMDVIVVDNCSTDGTIDFLAERWRPAAVVQNPTDKAHEPRFQAPVRPAGAPDPGVNGTANGAVPAPGSAHPFHSLTLIHNHANFGGCGGFNTGLAFIDHALGGAGGSPASPPGFAWLVDDDAEVAPDALTQLTRAAATDPTIGLVGSRTVDIADRRTTIETTIYFNRHTGGMGDHPVPDHPRYASHKQWIQRVGATRGGRLYTGLRDVDIVSACSMLARWSAVTKVGFWDSRYFIYCDDADWCMRFAKAGYRVVLNLDAVVYHTPWNLKLTPARIYYSQRNAVWMIQKLLTGRELRRATLGWMKTILWDCLKASLHRRLFHAEIIRRTALDITRNRAGKLDQEGPEPVPVMEALRRAGALGGGGRGARVAIVCSAPPFIGFADSLRRHVRQHLAAGAPGVEPRWLYIVRNDVPDPLASTPGQPERIVYSSRRRSRLRRQLALLRRWPRAVVVFDQTNDFPAVAGKWNIHIEMKKPTIAQLERDGMLARLAFLARWIPTVPRCLFYALTVRPYTSAGRYG